MGREHQRGGGGPVLPAPCRQRVAVRGDPYGRGAAYRERADGLRHLGGGAEAQLDLIVRQPSLIEDDDRVGLEPDDPPARGRRCTTGRRRSRACPGGSRALSYAARRRRGRGGTMGSPLGSLVPARQVVRLLVGELIDLDAHRLELEPRDLAVDLLRHTVDLALE